MYQINVKCNIFFRIELLDITIISELQQFGDQGLFQLMLRNK